MIWLIHVPDTPWATLVVRAGSEEEACRVGLAAARTYGDYEAVSAELLHPDGPSEALIEDWS